MKSAKEIFDMPVAMAVLAAGVVFIVTITLQRTGYLEFLETFAYDCCIALQPKITAGPLKIVLVGITEDDIRKRGKWPLTDADLADLLQTLCRMHPRAVGMDIFRDFSVPPGEAELDAALSRHPAIVAVMKFGDGGIPGPPVLKNTDRVGFNDLIVDPDGIIRRALLFLDDGKTSAEAFALKLALLYLKPEGILPRSDTSHPDFIRLGPRTIRPFEADDGPYVHADNRGYQFLVDFKDGADSFPLFSVQDLMTGKIPQEMISDRIVIVGTVAQDVKDFFFTPYSKGMDADSHIPGIMIHAHITGQILRWAQGKSAPVSTVTRPLAGGWILAWCLLGGVLGLRIRNPWYFSSLAASGGGVLLLSAFCLFLSGYWIPVVPAELGWLGTAVVVTAQISSREKRQRASLMQIFSMHVSPSLARVIWQQRDRFLSGGQLQSQKMTATILFADLKGFSPVAEELDPLVLTEWLNTYMDQMTQIVMAHDGIVDDYAGDGIKADFGTPLARSTDEEIRRDAANAVCCAVLMGNEMQRINADWQAKGLPVAGLRIGIHTGPVVAGTFGSTQRLKYTTIGNTVNIASRLESYDREHVGTDFDKGCCRIFISEATRRYLGERFQTRKIGDIRLKGQKTDIAVYHVLAWNPEKAFTREKEPIQ